MAVHQFLRVVQRPRDADEENHLRAELGGQLAGDKDFVGVCDRNGHLQLVFRKPDYEKWVRDMLKEDYSPEAAALGFARRITRKPNLVIQKRAA